MRSNASFIPPLIFWSVYLPLFLILIPSWANLFFKKTSREGTPMTPGDKLFHYLTAPTVRKLLLLSGSKSIISNHWLLFYLGVLWRHPHIMENCYYVIAYFSLEYPFLKQIFINLTSWVPPGSFALFCNFFSYSPSFLFYGKLEPVFQVWFD